MPSTNQKLLFTLIFCLYLNSAVSRTFTNSNITCATYFGVNSCSTCQKTAYGRFDESVSNCFKPSAFNSTVAYLNYTDASVSALLMSTCALTCNQTAINSLNENIQRDCQQELATNSDIKTSTLWFEVYSAIPTMQSLCSQASNGSYCYLTVRSNIEDYLMSYLKIKQDIDLQMFPPNATVTYGSQTVVLPKSITCSDCFLALEKPWIGYFKMNPSSIPAIQSLLDKFIKPFDGNYTQCSQKSTNGSNEVLKVYWSLISVLSLIVYYLM
ncbi:2611_t:CDS:2 [Ambispora leptoticha]|uniref:2611_t:CDS:1 n=1 Tax=Ambispora leptoticha TaxID=144679 RepID=A0A9N9CSV1_9GLOM|nr:2611_t:CDS:2 [Ambispora leptoticha]